MIQSASIDGLDDTHALDIVGSLIDAASDGASPQGVHDALALGERLRQRGLGPDHEAVLWYFVGNAWASLRHMRTAAGDAIWEWEQPEIREEIIAFRRALNPETIRHVDKARRCQIHTNLGNLFSTVGRSIDAVESFDRALGEHARFGMALGNKALCLVGYARALYDPGHRLVFAGVARRLVEQALALPLETESAREGFGRLHVDLRRVTDGHDCSELEHLDSYPIGEGADAPFRSWALREQLFLNPLNDLGPFGIAARDILHLPTMTVARETGTGFHGFYNQLKQEFATARWFLFEGLHPPARHLADADLVLLDTFDGTAFGHSLEKVKFAFRSAYSLLDKIAVFLATYLDFKMDMHRVNFRSVWYANGHPKSGLWPLLALLRQVA
jgi:hypothetical protein